MKNITLDITKAAQFLQAGAVEAFEPQVKAAQEALEMGLINKVVPFDRLEDETVEWCETILQRSPMAIRMIKRALNAELDGQAGLMEFAGDATLMYYLMDEAQEGKNAFLEKRDPDFDQFPQFPG